jgi:hypothetical protein
MADMPYMVSAKNLKAIFAKIKAAGTPPKFTREFLASNLGFQSSNDRAVIGVLKALGFLNADGVPTARYNEFRDQNRSGVAMAVGLRDGWSAVFLSDERANERSVGELKELFKNVTGKGEAVAEKLATTFKNLTDVATWDAVNPLPADLPTEPTGEAQGTPAGPEIMGLRLHHDIHIHLPPTSDVAVYSAIFRALRTELLD